MEYYTSVFFSAGIYVHVDTLFYFLYTISTQKEAHLVFLFFIYCIDYLDFKSYDVFAIEYGVGVIYDVTGNWVLIPSCPSNRNTDELSIKPLQYEREGESEDDVKPVDLPYTKVFSWVLR